MPKKEEELVRIGESGGSLEVPDYLAGDSNMLGFEGMGREDMTLPRLGLCQSMTPQRKKDMPGYIQGLEEGQWFNTITGENYGDVVFVTPLLFYKTRIRFFPLESGGGIRCQARDFHTGVGDPGGDCDRCSLATFNGTAKPECNKFFNYPALAWKPNTMPGTSSLLVVSFKSTGLKAAAAWNSLMQLRRKSMFTGVYRFSSVTQTNSAKQSWYAPVIKNADWLPANLLALVKGLYETVHAAQKEGRVNVHMDQNDDANYNAEM